MSDYFPYTPGWRDKETDPRLDEVHWCPWCEDPPGVKPHAIGEGHFFNDLMVNCEIHGEQAHWSHEKDCWCLK